MKKNILKSFALLFIGVALFSCGEKKEEKKDSEKKEQTGEVIEEPVKIEYEAFDSAKLQGNWKVIDAQAYSKDQMMGQTFSFEGDSATFFKNVGDVGMAKGTFKIDNNMLSIEYKKPDPNGGGNVRITFEFNGGFFEDGKKLQMDASDMLITLERQ